MKIPRFFKSRIITLLTFVVMTQSCNGCLMQDIKNISTIEEYKSEQKKDAMMAIFYKPKCVFCIKVTPLIETINKDYKQKKNLSIVKVNLSEKGTSSLRESNEIKTVPTIIIYKKGKLLKKFDAENQEERTEENIKKTLDLALSPIEIKSDTEEKEEEKEKQDQLNSNETITTDTNKITPKEKEIKK